MFETTTTDVCLCPSAVPQPQYECIGSKPQTFEAPLTLTRCCFALLVASAAAPTHEEDRAAYRSKGLFSVIPTSAASGSEIWRENGLKTSVGANV